MKNIAYFFSSRQCAPSSGVRQWLIGGREMINAEEGILLSVNNSDNVINNLKSLYHNSFDKDWNSLISSFYQKNSLEDGDYEIFLEICNDIKRYYINDNGKPSEDNKLQTKKDIEEYIELFKKMDLITHSILFKDVYTIEGEEGENWILYAVKELSNDDFSNVKGKSTDEGGNPLWCDLIIDYLKRFRYSSIHLFLHDKDISGFSVDSITHIDDIEEIKELGLISEKTSNTLKVDKTKLTITFFKHDSPLIFNLVGEGAKTEGLKERFDDFLNNKMGKVSKLNRKSKDCYKTITENKENNLNIVKECPFVKITKQ